ncbi:hypothetical protein EYR38_008298 [Pleurotus pulmonarius]|nr:hypothetical protein EYR38_008298 [Pleurotus pulmonarius]
MSNALATSIFVRFSNAISPVLLGAFASFPLFGVTIAQTIWYFRRYPEDSMTLKYLIASLLFVYSPPIQADDTHSTSYLRLIDVIQTWGTAEASMTLFLRHKISLDYPLGILIHLYFTTASVAIVQGIYAYRVWISESFPPRFQGSNAHALFSVSEKNRPLLCMLILLMTCQLAAGTGIYATYLIFLDSLVHSSFTAFDILQEVHGDASHLHIRVNDIIGTLSMGSRMACDILISISLVYYLSKWRSEIRRTENIIDGIIVYVVGVGVVTSAFSALVFITWLALPHQFLFMLFFSILIYVNSLLVTLNARASLRNKNNTESEYEELE